MSQEHSQRPRPDQEPIKYGDVFHVSGQLASKPVTPRDAATAQAAETKLLGQTPSGGAAAVMESAASLNQEAGLVGFLDATYVGREQAVNMSQILWMVIALSKNPSGTGS